MKNLNNTIRKIAGVLLFILVALIITWFWAEGNVLAIVKKALGVNAILITFCYLLDKATE